MSDRVTWMKNPLRKNSLSGTSCPGTREDVEHSVVEALTYHLLDTITFQTSHLANP